MTEKRSLPNNTNLPFVEGLFAEYVSNPDSVPVEWRRYFEELSEGERSDGNLRLGPSFRPSSLFNPPIELQRDATVRRGEPKTSMLQDRIAQLLRSYRSRGHMMAQIDPLNRPRVHPPELDPKFHGFAEADMDRRFSCGTLSPNQEPLTLREIIERLQNTYCRSIGVQYTHIDDFTIRFWLQERMERTQNRLALSKEEQLRIFTRLTDATVFEEFIRKKFIGAKSFSLEGSESLIPLLDLAIERAGEQGVDEIVMAMAHRGRLNVLANIMGKSPRQIFREFEDATPQLHAGRGDVKYHLGYSNEWLTSSGRKVHLSLCFNPSHLEFVNPVATGRLRAKQDRADDADHSRGMLLLIHGDAAFIAEGVVQETLNLSRLPGYTVGGTLHVVINNQIGFTTSPSEGRSTMYATSGTKLLPAPIFHVNGEDPEAVAQCVQLALEFRRTFKLDAVIDMYGYRRLGHNESDEPSFTQPLLYRAIEQRKSVREGYLDHLLKLNEVTREEADKIARQRYELLEKNLAEARVGHNSLAIESFGGIWKGYIGGLESKAGEVETGLDKARAAALLEALTQLPESFHPHPKIKRGLEAHREMAQGKRPLDWAAGEALAFASLATEGYRIRLSGQDSQRGTFSHRHAVLHDVEDGHLYVPLQHITEGQAPVELLNSPLSETGVLGFEYGYSLDCPDGLILWEAQFGDFINAAQVIVDQFIASAEDKWRRLSGLVLLLPHGFEGMGPEHSHARLERFLALAAEDNIQVVNATTPAQYFHCLRRQALRRWRKPLVIMTPKSLLRHPAAVSPLDEFVTGAFQRIIPDTKAGPADQVKRVLLCSGKIYYELDQRRDELKRSDVAIIRVEQLYPLRQELVRDVLAPFADGTPVYWVQEEPENMGAWRSLRVAWGEKLFGRLPFARISRPASPSPATGSARVHKLEQEKLLDEALARS